METKPGDCIYLYIYIVYIFIVSDGCQLTKLTMLKSHGGRVAWHVIWVPVTKAGRWQCSNNIPSSSACIDADILRVPDMGATP